MLEESDDGSVIAGNAQGSFAEEARDAALHPDCWLIVEVGVVKSRTADAPEAIDG